MSKRSFPIELTDLNSYLDFFEKKKLDFKVISYSLLIHLLISFLVCDGWTWE